MSFAGIYGLGTHCGRNCMFIAKGTSYDANLFKCKDRINSNKVSIIPITRKTEVGRDEEWEFQTRQRTTGTSSLEGICWTTWFYPLLAPTDNCILSLPSFGPALCFLQPNRIICWWLLKLCLLVLSSVVNPMHANWTVIKIKSLKM